MYPMQGTPSEDEPTTSGFPTEDTDVVEEVAIWVARVWVAAWLISMLVVLWRNERTRLEVLNATTRTLHTVATAIGTWALKTEKAYYDTVNSLH